MNKRLNSRHAFLEMNSSKPVPFLIINSDAASRWQGEFKFKLCGCYPLKIITSAACYYWSRQFTCILFLFSFRPICGKMEVNLWTEHCFGTEGLSDSDDWLSYCMRHDSSQHSHKNRKDRTTKTDTLEPPLTTSSKNGTVKQSNQSDSGFV